MNLLQLRQLFLRQTGRVDLVNSDGSDNGFNQLLKESQRYLEMHPWVSGSKRRWQLLIPSGTSRVAVKNCRVVEEVWISDSEGRVKLLPLAESEFRSKYPDLYLDEDLATGIVNRTTALEDGVPKYFALYTLGLPAEQNYTSTAQLASLAPEELKYDYQDIMAGEFFSYQGIKIGPVPAVQSTITVFGEFFHEVLSGDTDQNWWSIRCPQLLIMSCNYQIELNYNRNESGAKVYAQQISDQIQQFSFDLIEHESSMHTKMRG